MESALEKRTLIAALNAMKLNELPEELKADEEKDWMKGIALVYKADCSRNYAVVVNNGYGGARIMQDFGNVAIISRVEKIFPSMFLEDGIMPDIRRKSDIIQYLTARGLQSDTVKSLLSAKDKDGKAKTEEELERDHRDVKAIIIQLVIDEFLNQSEE